MTGLPVLKQLIGKSDECGSTSCQLQLLQTIMLSVVIAESANTGKTMGLAWKCSCYPLYPD